MAPDNIRKQSLWLYGVIVGLALKEGLSLVLPHILETPPPFHYRAEHFGEVWRLFVFIILAIRFFFGATVYFDEAYEKQHVAEVAGVPNQNKYEKKSFGTDFLIGFFHFILFLMLAYSIPTHVSGSYPQDGWREGLFLGTICLILFYDVVWLLTNWVNDTFHLIKRWAFFNIITLLVMMSTYLVIWATYVYITKAPFDYYLCESIVLIPVVLVSGLDMIEQVVGKPILRDMLLKVGDWFQNLGNRIGSWFKNLGN